MHYYQFNIKDYKAHTDHLSLMEDLAFRRMLDWVYLHEKPLPINPTEIAKRVLMPTHCESIEFILSEFFELIEDGYVNRTATDNIDSFKAKSEKASKSAKVRWDKKPDANDMRTHTEGNANNKPLTINNKPLTTNQLKDKDLPAIAEEFVFKLPTNKLDVFYLVTIEEINNYKSTYQAVDINQQYKAIISWLSTNSRNRKTKSGMPRFINSWLSKAQNSAPRVDQPQQRPVSKTEFFK